MRSARWMAGTRRNKKKPRPNLARRKGSTSRDPWSGWTPLGTVNCGCSCCSYKPNSVNVKTFFKEGKNTDIDTTTFGGQVSWVLRQSAVLMWNATGATSYIQPEK